MSKHATVVILSDKNDAHLPFVTRHLVARHIVIDPAQMQYGVELSYAIRKGVLRVLYDGTVLDSLGGEVVSVWCRKPQDFTMGLLPVSEDYVHYAASASQGHADILRSLFPNALWVSDYYRMKRASSKPWQLQVAHQIGFSTPDTLMTSSNEAAKRFLEKHKTVIVKTLAKVFPHASDPNSKPVAFFAKKLTLGDSVHLTGLEVAPAIFQQAIDVDVDIRVSVVGDEVFAATIRGSAIDKADSTVRDWRIAHCEGDMLIEPYDLPKDIARMCIQHVKALGLCFGAIDIVKDKRGFYWFLENNPNGQWAFVEEETGQPIGKAVAQLLESRH
ncbi:MAG: hypothetical protein ACREGD_02410 [Candidatus Saccharimonadales bacterium]